MAELFSKNCGRLGYQYILDPNCTRGTLKLTSRAANTEFGLLQFGLVFAMVDSPDTSGADFPTLFTASACVIIKDDRSYHLRRLRLG